MRMLVGNLARRAAGSFRPRSLQRAPVMVSKHRLYSSSKDGQEEPKRQRLLPSTGPLSPIGISMFLLTTAGIVYYFTIRKEQIRLEQQAARSKQQVIGRPAIGGPFELTDQDGNRVTEQTFHGKFSLIYFGFCHCPDICPDELDKIGEAMDILEQNSLTRGTVQPIFITCDPQRDTPEAIREYLEQFHPSFVGLTGSVEEVRRACKAFRVYFSKPPKVKEGQDYLVDHSIFSYLMDPDGQFVEVYGKDKEAKEMANDMVGRISTFLEAGRKVEKAK